MALLANNVNTSGQLNADAGLYNTVNVANGGTNLSATPTNGQLLIGNGTGYTLATLTAGAGISIANAAGSITLTNSGASSVNGKTGVIQSVVIPMTTQASTSGTSIDFTSIPSWVQKVTVIFNNVSTSGTSYYLIQLGSGSVQTTGYKSLSDNGAAATTSTTGMVMITGLAAWQAAGALTIYLLSGSSYVTNHVTVQNNTAASAYCSRGAGTVTLAGALDRVRITTVNGTDTFDAGSINILYE